MRPTLVNAAKAPELVKKLFVTFGLLAVYRMGVFVPTPGVNSAALKDFIGNGGNIFGIFNSFTGGALERFSVFALGIMPYISASIIMSLLPSVFEHFANLKKEGELGRRKLNQYSRYLTILIAVIQAWGIASWLQSNPGVVINPGIGFKLLTVLTLTAGTVVVMWLGEQITQRGIGQGSSLIIFAGIVAGFPSVVANLWGNFQAGDLRGSQLLTIAVLVVASTVFVVFVERAQRRIPIHHAKRVVGRKVYGASMQFLPFKVNAAGVIPPIFASALITFPSMMSQMFKSDNRWLNEVSAWLAPGGTFYDALYVGLIVFFSYFTTSIFINSNDVAENLKEHGGFVPGIRPGKHTADYLDHVLTRLTTLGAVYLSFICVAPFFFFDSFQVFLGGTAVLIIVGVAINFAEQIQTYLMTQQYDRFLGDEGASGNRRFKGRGPE